MSVIIVFEDADISIRVYPDSKIVHHQIKRFLYGEPFRKALNKGAAAFQQYGARKWLSDDRAQTAFVQEDIEWGDNDWFPRVAGMGWKYWAIVRPPKMVGQLSLARLADKYAAQGVVARFFATAEEGREWLESCE